MTVTCKAGRISPCGVCATLLYFDNTHVIIYLSGAKAEG